MYINSDINNTINSNSIRATIPQPFGCKHCHDGPRRARVSLGNPQAPSSTMGKLGQIRPMNLERGVWHTGFDWEWMTDDEPPENEKAAPSDTQQVQKDAQDDKKGVMGDGAKECSKEEATRSTIMSPKEVS